MAKKKRCFVIAPIGEEGGAERRRSDQVLEHFIRPAVEAYGYEPTSFATWTSERERGPPSSRGDALLTLGQPNLSTFKREPFRDRVLVSSGMRLWCRSTASPISRLCPRA